jgi:hypothetical protein
MKTAKWRTRGLVVASRTHAAQITAMHNRFSLSRQLSLNQTISALRMLENADNLEAGSLH